MKKLILMLCFLVVGLFSMATSPKQGAKAVILMPNTMEYFNHQYDAGNFVYVDSTRYLYELRVDVSPAVNMKWVLASSARYYAAPNIAVLSSTTMTVSGISSLAGILSNYLQTRDSVYPYVTAGSAVGTLTHKFGYGYINTITATTGNITTVAATTVGATGNITGANVTATTRVNTTNVHSTADSTTTLVASGNGSFGGTLLVSGALTASVLPTFTLACGTATCTLLADTVNVPIAGITSNSIVICSYAAALSGTDTACWVKTVKASSITLAGKHGRAINYWIPKK